MYIYTYMSVFSEDAEGTGEVKSTLLERPVSLLDAKGYVIPLKVFLSFLFFVFFE